jgi:hypothetical protein
VLVRYADDLLAFCRSREHAEQVRQQLAEWLQPRGLVFNEAKTQIVVRHEAARSEWIRRWEGRRMSVT